MRFEAERLRQSMGIGTNCYSESKCPGLLVCMALTCMTGQCRPTTTVVMRWQSKCCSIPDTPGGTQGIMFSWIQLES
jgi:hypothetical protein